MRCKINSITHINIINMLSTRRKYNHYSHPVRLHTHTHTPYHRLPHTYTHTYIHPPTLRALLKDVVNQCLEFDTHPDISVSLTLAHIITLNWTKV